MPQEITATATRPADHPLGGHVELVEISHSTALTHRILQALTGVPDAPWHAAPAGAAAAAAVAAIALIALDEDRSALAETATHLEALVQEGCTLWFARC